MSPCSPPLGLPGNHDRRGPPGSPAGLLVFVDEDGLRGIAPPSSDGFALFQEHQLDRSIDPPAGHLERDFPSNTDSPGPNGGVGSRSVGIRKLIASWPVARQLTGDDPLGLG